MPAKNKQVKNAPLTPQQAVNNFKLLLELSPRNTYAEFRAAVREIAETCIGLGVAEAETPHTFRVQLHDFDAVSSVARVEITSDEEQLLVNVISAAVHHWGKQRVMRALK